MELDRGRLAPRRGAALDHARRIPGTLVYLFVLALTSLTLTGLPPGAAHRLLLAQSTNLAHLEHEPLRVLVVSAFWISSAGGLWFYLLVGLALSPVERLLGTGRWIVAFAAGHVGATLVTVGGIWAGIRLGIGDPALAHARDVGASYGFASLAGLATLALPRPLRVPYAAVLVALAALGVALTRGFTDVGHLIGVAIGLALVPLLRPTSAR